MLLASSSEMTLQLEQVQQSPLFLLLLLVIFICPMMALALGEAKEKDNDPPIISQGSDPVIGGLVMASMLALFAFVILGFMYYHEGKNSEKIAGNKYILTSNEFYGNLSDHFQELNEKDIDRTMRDHRIFMEWKTQSTNNSPIPILGPKKPLTESSEGTLYDFDKSELVDLKGQTWTGCEFDLSNPRTEDDHALVDVSIACDPEPVPTKSNPLEENNANNDNS